MLYELKTFGGGTNFTWLWDIFWGVEERSKTKICEALFESSALNFRSLAARYNGH